MSYQIYHNPRCRKSRETLKILQDHGIDPEVILYLEEVPHVDDLKNLGKMIGKGPAEFIRKGDAKKLGMGSKELGEMGDDQLFELMAKHPILIERPIVVKDEGVAILGRPPENVLALLN